jgi:hypothetical protein
MEKLAARSHIAPGTPVLPRVGMNRRSPDPISCAAPASADVGQGHPTRTRNVYRTRPARPPPLTRRPHPCRALVEAATHACTAPVYRQRYQQAKTRIAKQRGAKVAQIDLARRLTEAIWHMLTRQATLRSQRRHPPPGRIDGPL